MRSASLRGRNPESDELERGSVGSDVFPDQLVNVINVPILMIGTMKALPLMTSSFRTARRGEGNGSSSMMRCRSTESGVPL
jgi:hypothetical protein